MSTIEDVDFDTRCKLLQLCEEYLGDIWTNVKQEDVVFKTMSTGFANNTYYCSIANCEISEKYENANQKEVIVHLYGSGIFADKNVLKFNGETGEAIILDILSKLGMYPKLYAVFPGGRIEEYIPSNVATVNDLNSLELSKAVIRKLAKIHSLNLPISKKPNLLEKMMCVINSGDKPSLDELRDKYNEQELTMIQIIFNFDTANEIDWIAGVIPKINHRVICSQNDMNSNNILLKHNYTSIDDQVMIIDFEMCRYFYRGYDIAYFLRMKKSSLRLTDEKKLVITEEEAISDGDNDHILDEYLKTFSKITKKFDRKYDTVDHLKMEIALFDLLYDCMLIGYITAAVNNFPIALEHSASLATKYHAKKLAFVKKYGDVFER